MSKEEHLEGEPAITAISHSSVLVAEGTGKTGELEGAKSKTVHNAELYAALAETKIEKWSKSSMHLYFCIFTSFMCACANGFDGSLMGAISAMPHFMKTFGTKLDGPEIAVISSLYNVGGIVATPVSAMISDRYGRRIGMAVGACTIILGTILSATSSTVAQITVGRVVLGGGICFMTVAAPAYSIEVSPPHWRGRATGFYNCGWFGGSIPAALVTFGCQYLDNDYSWRVPLILQSFACFFVLIAVFFIPESPRYQMANGRETEAIAFLVKYHGNGDPNSRLVKLEIEEIRESIQQESELNKRSWDPRSLFATHNTRWRSAQALMIGVFGIFSGNGLGYYNPAIFAMIGVTTTVQQLGYNLVNTVVSATGALTATSLTDRMPRRKVLVNGTFLCALMLAANAGLTHALSNDQAANDGVITNRSLGQGALAFYFLFGLVYSFTYTPLQGVIPAEALDTANRAKGLALYGFTVNTVSFISVYAGPIALRNIGFKYIYVFVGWDIVEAALWYFFCVESQGRTLEQLDWVYDQPNPVKASLKVETVILQADGRVSEKIVDLGNI